MAASESSSRCSRTRDFQVEKAIACPRAACVRRRAAPQAALGDDVLEAGPGELVFKPRGEWHTFWNAGEAPCRILEIIAPAGFERFFAELVDLGGVAQADQATLGNLCQRYALEMDPASIPDLVERFGVRFPGEPLMP